MTDLQVVPGVESIIGTWRGRPTFAVIDLDAYASNLKLLRSMVGADVVLTAVVKGNAYGHGAIPLAKHAIAAGADEIATATVDEGVQLRQAGIEAPILVMGAIGRNEVARAISHRLQLVISDLLFASYVSNEAKHLLWKDKVLVHLKIDTGMRRFGVPVEEAVAAAQSILKHENLQLAGVMSHLSSADDPDPTSAHDQLAEFDQAIAQLEAAGIAVPQQHIANSAATLRFPHFHRGRVRSGVATFGLRPDVGMILPDGFRPILTIHSRVSRIMDLAPGDAVSYGRTYVASKRERAGLIPIGYADGYARAFSNTAHMSIRGQRADVLGRVCMDQTMIRLPDGMPIALEEPVVVIGDGTPLTAGAPTIDDLAALTGTISYELSTRLQARLPKLYVHDGDLVGIDDLSGYRDV